MIIIIKMYYIFTFIALGFVQFSFKIGMIIILMQSKTCCTLLCLN